MLFVGFYFKNLTKALSGLFVFNPAQWLEERHVPDFI
jgi:hypothetical protein